MNNKEIKPDDYQAWYEQGNELSKLGKYEEAIASYDKAIEIKPDDPDIWNNLGLTLLDLGRFEKAMASFEKP